MKLWNEFYDFVMPHVPGVDTAMVDFHLRETAIEFYERSQAWRYVHAPITVTALTANYPYVTPDPAQTEVHVINYAEFNDDEIGSQTSQFSSRYKDWRNLISQPEFVIGSQTEAILVPIPSLDGTLDLIVSLKPTVDSTGIDDDLQFNDYRATMVHGALYRLMRIPAKPYTSQELAYAHMVDFSAGITAANIRVELEYTNAPLETGLRTIKRLENRRRINRDF